MADVLRKAGLVVHEVAGWKTRCFVNPSGSTSWPGYNPGQLTHIIMHHTASNPSTDGLADVNYNMHGAAWGGPISNLYLDRKGAWWVIAAGRTAHAGGGHDSWGGGVPNDMMNFYSIGIEAANRGDSSEKWPAVETTSYVKGVAALAAFYKIPVSHVRAHAEWQVGNKIDPAGPSPWAVTGTWNMNAFRNSLTVAMGQQPAPGGIPSPVPTKPPVFDPAHQLFGLYPVDPYKATVKLNSTGDLVKYLQGVLNKKGAKLALDGFFGPVTNTAVKAYQTATHIVVDGIVGAQTWAKIDYDALH
jgi:hypothetical protein